ncbi:GNAT family N-acetyltransferase [Ideonella sp. YS5]|uniref:GNAT family N-acetyltransferase n=1 Tax=Ideonella sp. YS5 TaxID=3453714 RepID=UPI003EF0301E
MPALTFVAVRSWPPPDGVEELLREYKAWLFREAAQGGLALDLEGGPSGAHDEVLAAICSATPSAGALYLLTMDGQPAALGGWRVLQDGVAEIKRLYVRPSLRGSGLGRRMLQQLMSDARRQGCLEVCLDTAPFMASARRLYLAEGFVDGAACEGTEVPVEWHARWHFMRRSLQE